MVTKEVWIMEKDEKNFELLKMYYDEWKFRQEGLWKRMIQFTIIIFFVSTLPITIGLFNGVQLPKLPLTIFPITGILLSIYFVIFCLCESVRINSIDTVIKTIEGDMFPQKYQKNTLKSLNKQDKQANRLFRARMAVWVPLFLSALQVIIAVMVLVLITTGNLA